MADEKLNVSPEENPQPSLFDAGPADAVFEIGRASCRERV